MSLRLRYDLYDEDGKIIKSHVSIGSITLYNDFHNLTVIHKSLFESLRHPMTLIREDFRYASPSHIMDYMFDVKTGELLPNKFLR